MISKYYCQECDNYINRRFKTKHLKSKAYLHMYYNIITNKYNIGDVYWCDFEKTINESRVNNSRKINIFSTIVKCKIDNEDISIFIDKIHGYVPYYQFDDDDDYLRIYCRSYNSKKILRYIFHRYKLYDTIFRLSTVIKEVVITFFSNYKYMTDNHKLQQPRRILESKILKHIKNATDDDKEAKYKFLSQVYELI